ASNTYVCDDGGRWYERQGQAIRCRPGLGGVERAVAIEPSDGISGHIERPGGRHMARQPSAVRELVGFAGIAVDRVVDAMEDPVVVPPPAFEGARVGVLD